MSRYLRHYCEQKIDLDHIEVKTERNIATSLRTIQVQCAVQQRKMVTVHTRTKTSQIEGAGMIKGDYFAAIVFALAQIIVDFA